MQGIEIQSETIFTDYQNIVAQYVVQVVTRQILENFRVEIGSRPKVMQIEQHVKRLTTLNSLEVRKLEEIVRNLVVPKPISQTNCGYS